jgi:hypothetical protein
VFFLLSACSGSDSGNLGKLNGKWVADAAESIKLSGEEFMDNEFALQMAEAIFGAITLEIDVKAQKITMSLGTEKREDTFKVISDSGNTIALQSEAKIIIEFVNDDFVIMRDEDEPDRAIAFKRAK